MMVKHFFIFFCALSFACSAWAAETTSPGQKAKQLAAQMQKLSQTLASERKQKAKVQEELREQELKIAKLNKKIQQLNEKIALQEKELQEQQVKQKELQQEIIQRQDHLAKSIRSLYATGKQPDLKLLLNQDNTVELQRLLTYYQYFNQALQQQITALDEDLGYQTQLQEKIAIAKDELVAERERQQEQQQQLQAEQKERNTLLANLSQSINSKDKELAELQASQKELQRVLAATQLNVVATAGPFSKQQGKLPWPTVGKVTHTFGSSRNGQLKYDGMVISAPEGQSIYAVFGGKVVYADWLRGYGLLVIIDHGNRYMSLYAHNETLYTKVGDTVKAGQQIGTVGTTGGLRNPSLYFEIRHNGKPINPHAWLSKQKA